MVLLSKELEVRWNGSTRKHYEARGYIWGGQNNWFIVPIEDAIKTTPNKVSVQCDYCGRIHDKPYRDYIRSREMIAKDCCSNRKCMYAKTEDVNMIKYGVKNINSLDEHKEKLRKANQTPKEEVLRIAENKGLLILNIDDYENDRTRLQVVCKTHNDKGLIDTTLADIKSKKHCCRYGGRIAVGLAKRKSVEDVRQSFIDSGLIPLFNDEDYTSNDVPLAYECHNHLDKGIQYRQFSNLPYTKGCYYCAKERTGEKLMSNEEEVFAYFESRGLIVEDGEKYEGKDKHIACRCVKHMDELQYKAYHPLKNTEEPCIYCRNDKSIAELSKILRSSIVSWRKESEKNCDYKCILTGSSKYAVHHLYSFNSIIKDSLKELEIDIEDYSSKDILNIKNLVINKHKDLLGVCIHPSIHILFHQSYSKENNTVSQFEEFKQRYYNGEFDEILREKEVV